jgi:hypothetical protein
MKVRRNDCDLFRYGPDITQKEENNKTILARIAVANQDVSTINLLRCSGKAMNMEAIRTTEKSVYFHETTRHYIPESCNLRKYQCSCLTLTDFLTVHRTLRKVLTFCKHLVVLFVKQFKGVTYC